MVSFQHPADIPALQRRVEKILADQGKSVKWLYEALDLSKTGYREMWTRQSVRVTVLAEIARLLGVSAGQLLGEMPPANLVSEPFSGYGGKRFLEERVEDLEKRLAVVEGEQRKARVHAHKR